jgi:maltooligosyltrehalose trehalohydrolase
VYYVQNHDQVGNRAFGRRLSHLVGVERTKLWAALLLLLPYTPMIFAGQEFAASSRFYYFTDHNEELGRAISEGRRRELARFAAFANDQRTFPDPQDRETFLASKLNLGERHEGVGELVVQLYREMIALRRADDVLSRQDRSSMRAIAASDQLLLVHMWHGEEQRLVVANIGVAIDAPPPGAGVPSDLAALPWRALVSTEERRFGGTDDQVRFDADLIALPPQTVALLACRSRQRSSDADGVLGRARGALSRLLGRLRGQRGAEA